MSGTYSGGRSIAHCVLWVAEIWVSSISPCLKPILNLLQSLFFHRAWISGLPRSQQHHVNREWGYCGLDLQHKCSLRPLVVLWHESAAQRAHEGIRRPPNPHHRPCEEGRCWGLLVWCLQPHRVYCKFACCATCRIWLTPLSSHMLLNTK